MTGVTLLLDDAQGSVTLERRGVVFVLRLARGENRFDRALLGALEAALDAVENTHGAAALVCTGSGRFFSNGYDLDALGHLDRGGRRAFIRDHEALLARWLRLPRPTLAAQGGHAVGAGALLALACDRRIMLREGALFWLPEIDARIPFRPGMWALLRQRLAPSALRDATLAGRRYGGADALRDGIVHELAAEEDLLELAVERASELAGRSAESVGALRRALDDEVADALLGRAGTRW